MEAFKRKAGERMKALLYIKSYFVKAIDIKCYEYKVAESGFFYDHSMRFKINDREKYLTFKAESRQAIYKTERHQLWLRKTRKSLRWQGIKLRYIIFKR